MTRLRLTSSTTAPAVSPAIQSYSHDQGSRRQLLLTDASALTTSAYTPDAADHHVAGDAHHIQLVSAPLSAGIVFTSGDVLQLCMQGTQPNGSCNQFLQVFVSVVDSAGTTVRATIRSKVVDNTEIGGTLGSRFLSTTLSASYTTVADDRLVVEISTEGTPAAGGGVNGHNASLRWGNDGAGGDLAGNDTETGTTLNPWIDFPSSTITENSGTNHTANPTDPEGLVDSATQVTDSDRPLTDPLGLVDAASGVTDSVRDQTDPLGLLDDVSYQVSSGTEQTFTDPLGLVDAAAQVSDQVRDATDPLGLVDTVTPAQNHARDLTDPLGLVDDGEWIAIGADAVGILDSTTVVQDHARELTDNLGLVDAVTAENGQAVSATDPLGLSDSATQITDSARPLTDPLGWTDAVVQAADYPRSVDDNLGLTDSVTYDLTSGGVAHTATITDGFGLVDQVNLIVNYASTITDALGGTDSHTRVGDAQRETMDPLGLNDDVSGSIVGPGFWSKNPVGFTKVPVGFRKIGPNDDPPWN